ncbi:MAG: O-antigen ligase family protein [Sedimenticola sp.]
MIIIQIQTDSYDRLKRDMPSTSIENETIDSNEINGKISKPILVSLFVIILCVNHFFNLVPWARVHGSFNSSDIGLLILVILLIFLLGSNKNKACLKNGISYMVLAYLFMVTAQVANVSFNYGQSITDGLIASRHQLYYLSFFVFLMIFDSEKSIKQFLNFVMLIGVALCLAGLVNYFGVKIFYHKWAEGHGVRAGVIRAFFSGMGVITFSLFWVISQWLVARKLGFSHKVSGILLILAHIMRQTRGTILTVFITVVVMLVHEGKVKILIGLGIFIVAISSVISIYEGTNILIEPFTSAYEDISEGGGTWEPRLKQLETDVSVFMEHPVFGGGTYAIRLNTDGKSLMELRQLTELHQNADLGYTHWIKSYGLVGGIWLICLYVLIGKHVKYVMSSIAKQMKPVALMAAGYSFFVMLSFVTEPHFVWPDKILLICIALAMIVRVRQLSSRS